PQLARSTTGGVEAHLALHDLRLALGSEARASAQAPDVYRACLRDVDGAHALARGTVAEVEILAVHEVAGVEADQMPEEIAPHCKEGAVDPVDRIRHAAAAGRQASHRRVEQQVAKRSEARGRRLPAPALVHQPAARDSGAGREEKRIDEGTERSRQQARV